MTIHDRMGQRRRTRMAMAGVILLLLGVLLLLARGWPQMRFGAVDEDVLIRVPPEGAAPDALVVTQSRLDYRRGEMVLAVPILELHVPVGESTRSEVLAQLPGLYEFSQIPQVGDVNVSIAAHRDIHGMEFYALDTLGEGDLLYLIYRDSIFRYRYLDTQIVPPDRWEVIQRQGFSCLTLTTCDPIGTTRNRLVVRAELVDIEPYGLQNDFAAKDGRQ